MNTEKSLKEQLEILRGEPIRVFTGDPMDIPCIETSDAERLCKNPVVSVNMITYNHEPYIRQAIEGVMMQKTDFEFELVIGEDCSTDRTREICFEYQKRYPDKIRVLWCDHNLYRNPHPAGGNGARNRAHCRGEFIAFCEGDDYWTDPLKLQKQVDVMRQHPNAVMCVAGCEWHLPNGSVYIDKVSNNLLKLDCLGVARHYFHTTTLLMRTTALRKVLVDYPEIPHWYDITFEVCISSIGETYFLPDVVSVYRWTGIGCGSDVNSRKRQQLLITQGIELALWGPDQTKQLFYRMLLSVCVMIFCWPKKRSEFRAHEMKAIGVIVKLSWRNLSFYNKCIVSGGILRRIVRKVCYSLNKSAKEYMCG